MEHSCAGAAAAAARVCLFEEAAICWKPSCRGGQGRALRSALEPPTLEQPSVGGGHGQLGLGLEE